MYFLQMQQRQEQCWCKFCTIWNTIQKQKRNRKETFSDVKSDIWFTDAVQWSVANTFATQKDITREDLVAILHRYAGNLASTGTELQFKDASKVSGYANQAMNWAVENGILNRTTKSTLNPKEPSIRAEVVAILMRFTNKLM